MDNTSGGDDFVAPARLSQGLHESIILEYAGMISAKATLLRRRRFKHGNPKSVLMRLYERFYALWRLTRYEKEIIRYYRDNSSSSGVTLEDIEEFFKEPVSTSPAWIDRCFQLSDSYERALRESEVVKR